MYHEIIELKINLYDYFNRYQKRKKRKAKKKKGKKPFDEIQYLFLI